MIEVSDARSPRFHPRHCGGGGRKVFAIHHAVYSHNYFHSQCHVTFHVEMKPQFTCSFPFSWAVGQVLVWTLFAVCVSTNILRWKPKNAAAGPWHSSGSEVAAIPFLERAFSFHSPQQDTGSQDAYVSKKMVHFHHRPCADTFNYSSEINSKYIQTSQNLKGRISLATRYLLFPYNKQTTTTKNPAESSLFSCP